MLYKCISYFNGLAITWQTLNLLFTTLIKYSRIGKNRPSLYLKLIFYVNLTLYVSFIEKARIFLVDISRGFNAYSLESKKSNNKADWQLTTQRNCQMEKCKFICGTMWRNKNCVFKWISQLFPFEFLEIEWRFPKNF